MIKMNNKKIILTEFEKLKGQFVITESWKVERLIAIGDDGFDYYYVTYDGRKTTWNTCVGKVVPLKGKIDDKHYSEFIRLAKINHHDQEDFFMPKTDAAKKEVKLQNEVHKKEMETLSAPDEFISEVCWTIK